MEKTQFIICRSQELLKSTSFVLCSGIGLPRLFCIKSGAVIPAKAGIQIRNTGFPRIKYGAGSVKPGMTNKGKRESGL
jgi:hypothetical protein